MDKMINSKAESIFSLALRAGLTEDTQADFLHKLDLELLKKDLEKEKQEFVSFNKNLNSAEDIWSQGLERHIDTKLIWQLINYSIKNNKGIGVDWRFTAGDLVANVQTIPTGLDIKALGEQEADGKSTQIVLIDGEEYVLGNEPWESIIEIMAVINNHLSKLGKLFIYYDLGTDDMYFLMVNKAVADEFGKYKFTLPGRA